MLKAFFFLFLGKRNCQKHIWFAHETFSKSVTFLHFKKRKQLKMHLSSSVSKEKLNFKLKLG